MSVALERLRQSIETYGYGVLEGFVEPQQAQSMVTKINQQVHLLAEAYGLSARDDTCRAFNLLTRKLHASPPGWVDPERPDWRLDFGARGNRGWMLALGRGRVFDGKDFAEDGQVERLQEHCRSVVASLHGGRGEQFASGVRHGISETRRIAKAQSPH